nr:39S ribosomal protein L35, mitochondrial-like isoform X2 [Cherax quadricarinatus]
MPAKLWQGGHEMGFLMLMQSVSLLSSCSRVALAASRPAVVARNVLKSIVGEKPNLSSRLFSCQQLSAATVTACNFALKTAPKLTAPLGTVPSVWMPKCQQYLLAPPLPLSTTQTRSVTKWSLRKGKRKTVRTVICRFKRISWPGRGIWIRPRAGAKNKMWKKSPAERRRCKTHVFCNATQSQMLDKMVTRYWKKPRYYPDDPYRPYMRRDNFHLTQSYPREFY